MNGFVGWTAALLIACASAVSAQETTGTITGRIVDAQGLAVPGVTVTVTGPQGTKTAVTDNDGRFTIPFLAPGTYRIQTDLPGFKPVVRENVQVRLGQTADVSFVIEVGGVNETVQVVGNAAVVDPTSTTIGANFDTTTLSRLPVGRRFSDTLYLAPGVSSSGTAGSANPSVSGSSGLENQYVVDGVNITNGGYGALGSYSIVFGSLGNGTPFDFMQEVQIKTGGYEAEFGQATGGVINVVTKTGTNSLRGSLFGYARPSKLESAYDQVKSVNGTVNTVGAHVSDAGATVGGPIRHDRLFFFGAIDPQRETRTVVAPSGFPLASLGEVNRERRVLNYAAKGTWQITDTRRVNASFFGDPAHGLMGPQRGDALLKTSTSGFSELTMYGGHNQTVHYDDVLSPRFLLEASIGRALNRIQETPSVDAWFVSDRTVVPNVTSGGIGFYEAGNRSNNWQYEAKATNILSGYGEHGIKYGIDVENLTYDQINQRTGPTFLAPNGQQTATGATIQILPDPLFGKIYRVTRANLNAARTTKQTYTSFFVQDTWRVTDRLTLRPGVRYEREHLTGTLADLPFSNNWAPRVGATFDPRGDGRGKVFASYGRYYARVPNDLAARALSADAGIGADYFDAGLTRPIPNGVPAGPGGTTTHFSIAGAGADVIDPNAKLSYYNEYIVGTDYEVIAGLSVGVRFVHRDIGRVLEDVQPFPIVAADLGLPGADSVDYLLTNPGPATPTSGGLGATFESPVHNYNAIELTANKRLTNNWSLLTSYRYSRLRGTYEGFYRDDNGQSDPGITSLYDFPTNDPSYTAIGVPRFGYKGDIRFLGDLGSGPLPLDRPHQLKLYGTYTFPIGVNASLGIDVSSGKPLTGLAANPNPNYQNGGEIPLTPRGIGFVTSEGFRDRTPFTTTVNGQASYDLRLAGRNLMLVADVFNIFNTQTPLDYNNFYETTFGAINPDYGLRGSSGVINGQQLLTPRQIRVGARFEF
jgi:outer membrane receptor protein involved in Fe transport